MFQPLVMASSTLDRDPLEAELELIIEDELRRESLLSDAKDQDDSHPQPPASKRLRGPDLFGS